jgi:hypothetical protein
MPLFTVNFTVAVPGSCVIEADDAEAAAEQVARARHDELDLDEAKWEAPLVCEVTGEDGQAFNPAMVGPDLEEEVRPVKRHHLRAV